MRLFIAFLVVCCVGCTRSSRYAFTLKGDLDGMKYGKAFLIAPGDSAKILYTAEIDGGKFEIKGDIEGESQAVLFFHGWKEYGSDRRLFKVGKS